MTKKLAPLALIILIACTSAMGQSTEPARKTGRPGRVSLNESGVAVVPTAGGTPRRRTCFGGGRAASGASRTTVSRAWRMLAGARAGE